MYLRSLPSRERGLKLRRATEVYKPVIVAPLAGAWIEIVLHCPTLPPSLVAPLAGAWIEMFDWMGDNKGTDVAPLAGAWIEIKI